MNRNIEVLDINLNDLLNNNIEIIDIDEDIEIIDIDDVCFDSLTEYSNISDSFLKKVRSKLKHGKVCVITTCVVTLFITLTGVFVYKNNESFNYKSQDSIVFNSFDDNVSFNLNNEEYTTININDIYEEKGASLIVDGVDISDEVLIDSSDLDTSRVGVYHVVYTYSPYMNSVKRLYRTVNVVDNEKPVISLLGSDIHVMLVGEEYKESGIFISDNSNMDLSNNVVITNNVNNSKPGIYNINYSVSDGSGNTTSVDRTVIVKYSYNGNTNTILSNEFTDNGLYFSGMVQDNSFKYQVMLKNKNTGDKMYYDVNKTSNHYYNFNLDISSLANGNYEFYLVNNNLELMSNNMNSYLRIVRAHIGNKLVTMSYDKNCVNMLVEDFRYMYDVVIDPGHGGDDTGATNGKYIEKKINLEQSLYEKKRFEEHGLRVLLLRDSNDNFGQVMGDYTEDIDKKGYAVGYYGSVSRIVYSNHHNSSNNSTSAGWEILVGANRSYNDLSIQHSIADVWSNIYIKSTNPYYRFYTKDYETGTSNNKINGEIYDFEDYYSVIRIPNKLFNVNNVIYEGAYINNNSDMYWYYDSNNWKKLSEVKIKAYVESLGLKYIP